jgi:EpsD family peptidyl-prolyl cis-trans isomerase
MQVRHAGFFAALSLCLALAGCGRSDDKKVATQVAAKVNSEEITVHQVNNVLARNPNLPPEAAARAKRQVVERLVDQQLAVQQALEAKLDRSPQVVQALEAAKDEILARAYLRQVAARQAKATPEEIKQYYAEHPELFAQRRLYVLEEITFVPRDEIGAELRAELPGLRTMQAIAEWLKTREVQFTVNRGARAAEQIPIEMLPRLQGMKDGDIQVLESGERLIVVRVVATKPAPVDEAKAAPAIQQFLFNRRSSEVIAEEIKRLKGAAKIEYVGEFAQAGAAQPQPPPEAPKDPQQLDVEKGVRGLR